MGLRKFLKKARKAVGLPAITLGNVAKVAGAAALGGAPALGATVLKSRLRSAAVGGIKRIARTRAEKAQLQKIGTLAPPRVVGISSAVTMPGGAPLKGIRASRGNIDLAKIAKRERASERRAHAAARPRKTARKARSGAKRSPPKGGKDLKALSASWKAAGKPGKWLDWVKTH